jgi:hypothetical protein
MLVHIVADYGQGDLAFDEVVQRIKLYLSDAEPVSTPCRLSPRSRDLFPRAVAATATVRLGSGSGKSSGRLA